MNRRNIINNTDTRRWFIYSILVLFTPNLLCVLLCRLQDIVWFFFIKLYGIIIAFKSRLHFLNLKVINQNDLKLKITNQNYLKLNGTNQNYFKLNGTNQNYCWQQLISMILFVISVTVINEILLLVNIHFAHLHNWLLAGLPIASDKKRLT